MMSSEQMNESQLNYLLVKKWVGHEYKKKRLSTVLHVYLSVDFFYSVYAERPGKTGQVEQALKAVFAAESTSLNVREIEKVVEITYVEKGLLWDSKKKLRIQFSADVLEEFKLHYHQARIMFTDEEPRVDPDPEPQRPIHQSSIPLQGGYKDSGGKMPGELEKEPRPIQSARETLGPSRGSGEKEEEEDYYGEGLDEIERNYTSEKIIHIDEFNDILHEKKEIDEEFMKELQSEMFIFKKKIGQVEEIEEDQFEDASRSSSNSGQ